MAPIHVASEAGDLFEVKRLVEEEGVNPEEPDPSRYNARPLHRAAFNGKNNVVAYLLETCGVDVDGVDNKNRTALHYAGQKNQVSCIRLLLQHRADPNIVTPSNNFTPLMLIAYYGHLASMTALLQDGRCNLGTKRTDTGDTAIILAADQEKWDCVELLLSYHASPVATNNLGHSLYDYAVARQVPPQTLQLIQAAISEPDRARLLHRVRRINEAQHNPATDGPAFFRQRAADDLPLPSVELTFPDVGYEERQEKLRAVVQYVVGMKEDGSVGGGMLKEHVVELMDMLLPVWDAERAREEEEEEA